MKTLSSALLAALGGAVQQPALLVEAQFASTYRWSSAGTVSWNGQTWTARDVRIDGLSVQALQVRGTLVLGNADDVAGSLVLGEGVHDKVFRIWGFDAAATAISDVVWLCDCVGASATVDHKLVKIQLRHKTEFVLAPRTMVNAEAGFTQLLPADVTMKINNIDFVLNRD